MKFRFCQRVLHGSHSPGVRGELWSQKWVFPFPDLNATWLVEMSDKAQTYRNRPKYDLSRAPRKSSPGFSRVAVFQDAQAVAATGFGTLFTVLRICETIW